MKRRKAAIFGLAAALLLTQFQVSASKLQDAENEKSKAKQNLESVNGQIGDLEDKKTSIINEIAGIDKELGEIIINVSILEEKLTAKEDQLAAVQDQLAQAREDEKQQYDSMKKRIKFMYERGDTAFLTAILESKNISELLNQVEYYNEVYDYDRNLLVDYQKTKLEVEELEQQVETEIAEMEKDRAAYQEEKAKLEEIKADRKAQGDTVAAKLTDANKLAAEYMDTIHAQEVIIQAEKQRIAEEEEAARQAAAAEAARREEQAQRERERQQAAANNAASNTNANSGGGGSGNTGGGSDSGSTGGGGNANPAHTTGVSGQDIVNYGLQFVGNPYVWGGNDPNTGADCSGFVKYVFAKYGISLPRTSYALRSVGQEVSYANAQAGDLICYEGHVAIYMGGGQIVHAKGTAYGITTGSATYKSIITVRRVL